MRLDAKSLRLARDAKVQHEHGLMFAKKLVKPFRRGLPVGGKNLRYKFHALKHLLSHFSEERHQVRAGVIRYTRKRSKAGEQDHLRF